MFGALATLGGFEPPSRAGVKPLRETAGVDQLAPSVLASSGAAVGIVVAIVVVAFVAFLFVSAAFGVVTE